MREFAQKIGLDDSIYTGLSHLFAEDLCSGFYENPEKFIQNAKKRSDYNTFMLAVYVSLASKALPLYLQKGYIEQIYLDTFCDIALWSQVYLFESGTVGLADSEIEWLLPHTRAEIATLGRLQFKPSILDDEITLRSSKYNKGERFIEVHIPRGKPLLPEQVESSFELAAKYFGKNVLYGCYSWMLSPMLKQILPPSSNILGFASLFEISSIVLSNSSAERYINFASFAQNKKSTLYLGMEELAKSGKKIGAAVGWLYR